MYLRSKTTLTQPSVIPIRKPDNETPLNESFGGVAGGGCCCTCLWGVADGEVDVLIGGVFDAA